MPATHPHDTRRKCVILIISPPVRYHSPKKTKPRYFPPVVFPQFRRYARPLFAVLFCVSAWLVRCLGSLLVYIWPPHTFFVVVKFVVLFVVDNLSTAAPPYCSRAVCCNFPPYKALSLPKNQPGKVIPNHVQMRPDEFLPKAPKLANAPATRPRPAFSVILSRNPLRLGRFING